MAKGLRLSKQTTNQMYWLLLVQLVLGFEWLKSGWDKFAKPDFISGIDKSISAFAEKTKFKFYGDFLKSSDSNLLGNVTRISEILVGLALFVGGIYALRLRGKLANWQMLTLAAALYGGALLNLNFFLAAGHTSPATEGINIVMGLIQAVLGTYYVVNLRKR